MQVYFKFLIRSLSAFALLAIILSSAVAKAGVMVFTGDAGEAMMVETSPGLAKDEVLIKISGVESPWAGRVFKAKREIKPSEERYSFPYEVALTGKTLKKTYYVANETGKVLVNGSLVKKMRVYYEGGDQKGLELKYDAELTKKAAQEDLKGAFKKAPYVPEVE